MMAEFANLSPEALKLVQNLEDELAAQGIDAVLVAYSKYANLSPEALDLIQKLEATLKAQGADIVLLAYNK